MTFSPAEEQACRRLVELALEEDLGTAGDITSQAFIPADLQGKAVFVARSAGVLAGVPAAKLVLAAVDPNLSFSPLVEEGAGLQAGTRIASVQGSMRGILAGERTALNFVQRLSGVATQTRRYVDAVAGLPCLILDTRKTTPGWRLLEKYAVRCGGGENHRLGLYDGILIKDNHIHSLIKKAGPGIGQMVQQSRGRSRASFLEVEVETLDQLDEVLPGGPDIVLLDNMSLEMLREAVRRTRAVGVGVLLEASGGVTLESVRAIAETGVDRISVGALTHSAQALDIALDYDAA